MPPMKQILSAIVLATGFVACGQNKSIAPLVPDVQWPGEGLINTTISGDFVAGFDVYWKKRPRPNRIYDLKNRKIVWSLTNTYDDILNTSIILSDGYGYAIDATGTLHSVKLTDLNETTQKIAYQDASARPTQMLVMGGTLFIGTGDTNKHGEIFAYNLKDPANPVLMNKISGSIVNLIQDGTGRFASGEVGAAPDLIFVSTWESVTENLFAYDKNLNEVWKQKIPQPTDFFTGTGFIYRTDKVVTTTLANTIYSLDADTGKILWSLDTGDRVGYILAQDASRMYFASGPGNQCVTARNMVDGVVMWKACTNADPQRSASISESFVLKDGFLYLNNGAVWKIDTNSGKFVWVSDSVDGSVDGLLIWNNQLVSPGIVWRTFNF